MIHGITVGNIRHPNNKSDIVIGMNTTFADVKGIGAPYIKDIIRTRAITLGTVITFDFDGTRQLHMLICHKIGRAGWVNADQHVRYGMDHLWQRDNSRQYSIVQIGTGRVGKRDGADVPKIIRAIADSHLPVTMFVLNEGETIPVEATAQVSPFKPMRMWSKVGGEVPIRVAA